MLRAYPGPDRPMPRDAVAGRAVGRRGDGSERGASPTLRSMDRRPAPLRPGRRLVLVAVAVTAVIGTVATGIAVERYRSARDAAFAQVAADADAQAADAGQFVAGRLAVLSVVAGEAGRLSDPAAADGVVANLAESLPDLVGAVVVDPAAAVVAAGGRVVGAPGRGDRRWLDPARAGREVVVATDSDLFGGSMIVLAVPVVDADGAVVAVLAAAQSGSWLNGITRTREPGTRTEVFIVDLLSGTAIAAPSDADLGPVTRWPALGRVRQLEPAGSLLLDDGIGVAGERDRVVGVRRLVAADWAYALQRPVGDLVADARRELWISLALIGATALVAVAGALAIARRLDRLARRGREVSLTLQRRLLPSAVPRPGCCSVAARYLPAASDLLVGGDWYEVLELDDGRVVLAVGDVAGHGIDAAAEMGTLRAQLAALAAVDPAPGWLLGRLAAAADSLGVGLITLAYVLLDPATGTLELARAGHPPPIVVGADGRVEALWVDGAALGVPGRRVDAVERRALASVRAVVLYTDGLVERRGEAIDDGIERARRTVVARADAGPDELADHLLASLVGPEGADDDVAVVVARLDPVPPSSIGTEGTGATAPPTSR